MDNKPSELAARMAEAMQMRFEIGWSRRSDQLFTEATPEEVAAFIAEHIAPLEASCDSWKQESEGLAKMVIARTQELHTAETALAASQAECERLRSLGRKQQDEIETLNGYADAVERLREIGKATGCGHVDDPDGRRKLVNCVTQTIYDLENKIAATDEGPVAKWNCAAQRQGTAGGNEPAECNFPFCGCDPRAADVVEAMKESGWISPEELCREREMSAADNAALRQQVEGLRKCVNEWVDYFDNLESQNPGDPLNEARELYHGKRLKRCREVLAILALDAEGRIANALT